jgi:hypothetical protein
MIPAMQTIPHIIFLHRSEQNIETRMFQDPLRCAPDSRPKDLKPYVDATKPNIHEKRATRKTDRNGI